jgi:hypothetical protein
LNVFFGHDPSSGPDRWDHQLGPPITHYYHYNNCKSMIQDS